MITMPSQAPRLLADIGGTNARFALSIAGEVREHREFKSGDYPDLASAANAYLAQCDTQYVRPRAAAFAVAAPITGDQVAMTNHAWRFSVRELRRQLQLERVIVLNDFTALALALRHLPRTELEQVGGTREVDDAPIALLGPGTGLGVSGLLPYESHWLPLQGEGGHATVAASNDREADILRLLRKRFGHVSAERVVSGAGLVLLYETLCTLDRVDKQALQPEHVTQRALQESDAQCIEALQTFCALLGTMAGNLVLTLGALGGVYIGGGIVPRLGGWFASSPFRKRFETKGRYTEYLAPIPAYVIRSETPAFVGLAQSFDSPSPRVEASAD